MVGVSEMSNTSWGWLSHANLCPCLHARFPGGVSWHEQTVSCHSQERAAAGRAQPTASWAHRRQYHRTAAGSGQVWLGCGYPLGVTRETCPAPRFPSCWLFLSLMSKHELCLGKGRRKLHGILCTNTVAMGRQCPSMPGSMGHRTNSALLGWAPWVMEQTMLLQARLQPPWIPCIPGGQQRSPPCFLPSLETIPSCVCGLPCYWLCPCLCIRALGLWAISGAPHPVKRL